MNPFQKNLIEIDLLIKSADPDAAKVRLKALRRGRVLKREFILPYARLCRRASAPELGLNALRPLVRPSGRAGGSATEAEINEYAALLIRAGACREARALLSKGNLHSATPVVHTLAYLNVRQWNYPEAIKFFNEYIGRKDLDSYALQIGKLNLASCLVFEENTIEIKKIVSEVIESDDANRFGLVKAHAYMLLGMAAYFESNFSGAIEVLRKASELFPPSDTLDLFLVNKWAGVSQYALEKGSKSSERALKELRLQALNLKHWESVRDLDFLKAVLDGDSQKLIHIYFGTPFEEYRKRILRKFPSLEIPHSINWRPSGKAEDATHKFDIQNSNFKPGGAPHRLLCILTSDFYHPFSMVDIFDRVFSETYYCPKASEERVWQLIRRTRGLLAEEKVSLEIVVEKNRAHLFERDCSVVVHLEGKGEGEDYYRLNTIRSSLGDSFSVTEAAKLFSCTSRTINTLVSRAVSNGILSRNGQGKNTRYSFLPQSTPLKKVA